MTQSARAKLVKDMYPVQLILVCLLPSLHAFFIVPEDAPAGFLTFYGFSPRFLSGSDGRLGFGFRFGNHADLQLMYELGPQTTARPLRLRAASYRAQSVRRRRPLLEFLIKTGLLRDAETRYDFEILHD